MKTVTYLIVSIVLFCWSTRSFSQEQYNWNEIIKNTAGLEIETANKIININNNTDSWSIHSIFWNNSVDMDGDGFTRSRHLNWTWTSSYNPSFSVYFKLFYKEKTQGSYQLYTQSPEIVGSCTYSYCDYDFTGFVIGEVITLTHDEYDFKMEIYDYSSNTLLASATPSDNTNLNDQKFETPNQDSPTPTDWNQISGITTNDLVDIQFINEDIGWIAGKYNTLIKTLDGGNNWEIIPFFEGQTAMIHCLFFTNENVGWVSCTVVGKGIVLYKSIDGGYTWFGQGAFSQFGGVPDPMYFLNENIGYIGSTNGGRIFKTSNGGDSWDEVSPVEGILKTIYFFNESIGLAAGYQFLAKTFDGGNNWIQQFGKVNHDFTSLFFNDDSIGWACGRFDRTYRTTNGGESWSVLTSNFPNGGYYNSISSLNTATAFVVGNSGKILKTIDEGLSWVEQNSGTTLGLTDVDFSGDSNVWAVGANGMILHHQIPSPFISVSTSELNFEHIQSDEQSFDIFSNIAYNITTNADWISITPNQGSNNSTITVETLSQNPYNIERECEISVVGTEMEPIILNVTQNATPFLNIDNYNILFDSASGNSNTIAIESNINWQISWDQSWINVEPNIGSNNDTIIISTISTNTAADERTAIVAISGEDIPWKLVNVTQLGSEPYLDLSIDNIMLSNDIGNYDSFFISSNANWTISNNANWLNISQSNGSGDDEITVNTLSENILTIPRFATLTVSASGIQNSTVIVTQEGATPSLELSTNVITLDYLGGSVASFDIYSNFSWSLETFDDWFIMSQSTGSNNETITITALSNNEQSQTRTSSIIISGLDTISKEVTLIQMSNSDVNEHEYAKYISVFPNPINRTLSGRHDPAWSPC